MATPKSGRKGGVAGKLVADVRLFRSISFPHLEWAYGGEWGKLGAQRHFWSKELMEFNIQWSTQRKRRDLTSFSNIIFLCPESRNVVCDDEGNYCLLRRQAT